MEIINEAKLSEGIVTAVTIGKFDGVHIGHQKLLWNTVRYISEGYVPTVLTFDINGTHIMDITETRDIFKKMGIEILVESPFTEEIKNMNPEQFFLGFLINKLHAKAVIVGDDFRFGCNRIGNTDTLLELGKKYDVKIDIIKKEELDGITVSSTRIRDCIDKGDFYNVSRLLGRNYSISGEVKYGNQLGRTIGIPTVNISFEKDRIVPPKGVYASRLHYDNEVYDSITNIGVKPTVSGGSDLGVETYIFDFDKMIYGEPVTVELIDYQRCECRFADINELKKQMYKDISRAKETLSLYGAGVL